METRLPSCRRSREADIELLIRGPIDVSAVLREISDPGRGGTVVFLGSVRRGDEDGAVTSIEYSAYEAMVRDEARRILDDAEGRWPQARCVLQHRVGDVPAAEPSIVAAAAAPHRAQAFEACRFVIDEAKARLPVWKKEYFDGGASRWRS